MKLKDIARRGLQGRSKDSLLIKIVIILAFVFITASTTFQASSIKTKEEQQFDLYGSWHAAYLDGDKSILDRLQGEEEVDKLGYSQVLGYSNRLGVVGTFNEDLLEMGRFSLYKGRYPEKDNEIMVELQSLSDMGLDLEVGQKISVDIEIETLSQNTREYIMDLNEKFYNQGIYPDYLQHHEIPFETINGVTVIVSNDYLFYYPYNGESDPDLIREEGLLREQKVILKKEFEIVGIIQNYTDKWNLGDYPSPNAFITEEAGEVFIEAFYNNSIEDFSDFKWEHYNIFLKSDSLGKNLYDKLKENYPGRIIESEFDEFKDLHFSFWMGLYGASDEEIESALDEVRAYYIGRELEEWEDRSLEGNEVLKSIVEDNLANFRKNTFSYPDTGTSPDYYLALVIIAIIFVATALAIFQIFLTQIRRRSRRIVLLKSIGATKDQITKILLYEGLYFLKYGLLVGIPIGLLIALGIIFSLNKLGSRELIFYIEASLFIYGLLAGILALFIGMLIPTIYAIRIPLVGTMERPPVLNKARKKKEVKVEKKTFASLNWDYIRINKNKALISFGISFIILTILLSTLLLNYLAFENYRVNVLLNGRPDYVMEAVFGDRARNFPKIREELMALDGVESVQMYKVGRQTFLWYKDMGKNEILNTFEKLLPKEIVQGHFTKYNYGMEGLDEKINDAFITKIFGIDTRSEGSQELDKFKALVTEGNIDEKAFKEGKEIILMVPMYFPGNKNVELSSFPTKQVIDATNEDNRMKWLFHTSNTYQLSYDNRYKDYFKKQTYIKPGDTIYLSASVEGLSGETYYDDYITGEFKVGGIIHYLPKEGLWPFSESVPAYLVLASIDAMEYLYPRSIYGMGGYDNIQQLETMINMVYPHSYGRTLCYIKTDSVKTNPIFDANLLSYATNRGYILYNYKEGNSRIYYGAFNSALIISLLGLTATAIALIILYNTMVSKMEQDRNRLGILQALGVTREEFSYQYIKEGLIVGLVAIIISHLLIFSILLLTSTGALKEFNLSFSDYIKDIFTYKLIDYPWSLHLIFCILYLVVNVLIYYFPSRQITSKYPVENIRGLTR